MPVKTFAQFKSDCKKLTDDENALGNAVANQIMEYVDNSPHPRGKKDEAYERFFENIYKKTGQKPPAAIPESITGNQTPSKYRDEIKQGRGDQTFVIAIFYWFSEICEEKAYSEAIRKALTEVTPPEQSTPQPYLEPPFDGNLTEDDWLNPRYEDGIPFQGREYEKSQLTAFAKRNDNFKVWAVSGPSGAGKTRLVSHWMREFIKAEGQDGWNIGFFTRDAKDDFGVEEFKNWIPDKPTFIIIDYIYNFNDIIKALFDKCYREQIHLQHPIRLLLIDHVFPQRLEDITNDHYLGDLTTGSTDLFEKKKVFFDNSPMQLEKEQQNADDLKEIVAYAANMWNINSTPVDDKLIDEAISFLEKTKGAFCPLFAALKGYAIGQNYDTPFGDRRGLIKYYLESTERLPWCHKDKEQIKIGKWVGCFVSATTILRGVSFEHLGQFLPNDLYDSYDNIIAKCKTITSSRNSAILPPFEPDILGESFFLLWLETIIADHRHKAQFINILCNPKDHDKEQKQVENFLGFIERLTRNLCNDEKNLEQSSASEKSWDLIVDFLKPDRFKENTSMRCSVSIALVDIVKQLKEKNLEHFASELFKQIHTNDLERASDSFLYRDAAISFIQYFEWINETKKQTKSLEKSFLATLKTFEAHSKNKTTALMLAAFYGHIEASSLYIQEFKKNVNSTDSNGSTALFYSCFNGHKKITELLIRNNANINQSDKNGWFPLINACNGGQKDIAELLIKNNADVNQSTNIGYTALIITCVHGYKDIAELLIKNKADLNHKTNDFGVNALMVAMGGGFNDIVEVLIKHKAKVTDTMFRSACSESSKDIVELLIKNNIDIDQKTNNSGVTPLMHACKEGQKDIVELLINNNADVNRTTADLGLTALMFACIEGHKDIAELLINNNAHVNQSTTDIGATALMFACIEGHKDIVDLLIKHSANINLTTTDHVSLTAIMIASEGGHKKIVELLINNEAEINHATTDNGWTALMLACEKGELCIAKLLVDNQANINKRACNGETAYTIAKRSGNQKIISFLEAIIRN